MLTTQIGELKLLAHKLLYLTTDDTPVYADSLAELNKEVTRKANELFTAKASTDEEEALLCLALLMGYNAVMYSQTELEKRKQAILDRAGRILDKLPPSLLKCQLLTYCYGEVYDEELADEAHAIIDSWGERILTDEEQEIADTLTNLEKYPYPWSEVNE